MPILNPAFAAALVLAALATAALVLRLVPAARRQMAAASSRLRTIDGLRGYLAVGVAVHHAVITWFFLQGQGWNVPPSRLMTHLGQSAVALFFMVTAFLFWGRVLDRRGRLDWLSFAVGRAWRLYPAYLVALAGVLGIVAVLSDFTLREPARALLRGLRAWLLFTYPAAPDLNGVQGTGRLIAYVPWSLPYEVLFYAVLPLAAMLAFRAPRPAVAAGCAAVLALLLAQAGWRWVFGWPVLASFLGGIAAAHAARHEALARAARRPLAAAIGLGCLVLTVTLLPTAYTWQATLLLGVFFTVVACGNSLWGALDRPAAAWLGEASYSVYLLHGLVLFMVLDRLGGRLDPARADAWLFAALAMAAMVLVVVLASATALLVEFPGMAAGRRQSARLRARLDARRVRRGLSAGGPPVQTAPSSPAASPETACPPSTPSAASTPS